jgi:hypothetical protein
MNNYRSSPIFSVNSLKKNNIILKYEIYSIFCSHYIQKPLVKINYNEYEIERIDFTRLFPLDLIMVDLFIYNIKEDRIKLIVFKPKSYDNCFEFYQKINDCIIDISKKDNKEYITLYILIHKREI